MPSERFEGVTPAIERPQTYCLDSPATGIGVAMLRRMITYYHANIPSHNVTNFL